MNDMMKRRRLLCKNENGDFYTDFAGKSPNWTEISGTFHYGNGLYVLSSDGEAGDTTTWAGAYSKFLSIPCSYANTISVETKLTLEATDSNSQMGVIGIVVLGANKTGFVFNLADWWAPTEGKAVTVHSFANGVASTTRLHQTSYSATTVTKTIRVDGAASKFKLYIDDVLVYTHTSPLPSAISEIRIINCDISSTYPMANLKRVHYLSMREV